MSRLTLSKVRPMGQDPDQGNILVVCTCCPSELVVLDVLNVQEIRLAIIDPARLFLLWLLRQGLVPGIAGGNLSMFDTHRFLSANVMHLQRFSRSCVPCRAAKTPHHATWLSVAFWLHCKV